MRENLRVGENLRELIILENGKRMWFLSTLACDNRKKQNFALGGQNNVISLEYKKKYSESFLLGLCYQEEKKTPDGKRASAYIFGCKNQKRAVQFQMDFAQKVSHFYPGITLEVLSRYCV